VVPRLGQYRWYVVTSPYKDINLHLFKEGRESVLRAIENAKEVPIKDVEELAKRYGTKVFVLDNLMMIDLECSEYEIYSKTDHLAIKIKQ
jgi:hypothetical protein